MLLKKLKEGQKADNSDQQGGRDNDSLPFLFCQAMSESVVFRFA
jgi:hypothetical protein